MYALVFSPLVDKKILKLKKKNFGRYLILKKKLVEVLSSQKSYKKLRGTKFGLQRVHIDKHFVLTFRVNKTEKLIYIEDFDHHNKIYK